MWIATGEVEDKPDGPKPGKDAAATELGREGGADRTRKLTPEQRAEIARKGAAKHWQKNG